RAPGDEPARAMLVTMRTWQLAGHGTELDARQTARGLAPKAREALLARDEPIRDAKEQRRRRLQPDEGRISLAGEIADPYREHVRPDQSHAPRVAKAPRRAGLPGDRQLIERGRAVRAIGPRITLEHVEHQETGLLRE